MAFSLTELTDAAQVDPESAEVLADYHEQTGGYAAAKVLRERAKLLRGEQSPRFKESLKRTHAVRKHVPANMLPLFDHLIVLALSSYKHGYAKRAGRELLKARRLGHVVLQKKAARRFAKARRGYARLRSH